MNPAQSSFFVNSIRWAIYSFVGDDGSIKKQFDEVVLQIKLRFIYSKEVIPLIKAGTRLVATDNDIPCCNCYHFGRWPSAGSADGLCMNHRGVENVEKAWMTFGEFAKRSRNHGWHGSYEEYDIECRITFRREEEEEERYVRESERIIAEYYAGLANRRAN